MKRRTILFCLIFALIGSVTMGCQGKKEKRGGIAKGRNARGGDAGAKTSDRKVGGIFINTSGADKQDQNSFWYEVYVLTFAQLEGLSEDQQLGYVSGNVNVSSSGVRFWGDVPSNGKGGMDSSKAELHITVYDDRIDSTHPAITMNIGPKIEGFVQSSGSITNTSADLTFEDAYGAIRFVGQISNGDYAGKVYYYTYQTGSEHPRMLGAFKVKSAGFFR